MEERKKDHINMALDAQMKMANNDHRFNYEPMLSSHQFDEDQHFNFLGKPMKAPIWVSSMTGGTEMAEKINHNLAKVCKEFGLGMGLGSCRIILDNNKWLSHFDVRKIIGDEQPLYANLGIAQVENLLKNNKLRKISELITKLDADGLIIHVNPMQEYLQPEGDRLKFSPLETIKKITEKLKIKIIIKEVGQGLGPESLEEILKLPVAGIEFGAFGGTNFAKVELNRSDHLRKELFEPFSKIGQDAYRMTRDINDIVRKNNNMSDKQLIISGGIKNFLDGYHLINISTLPAIYGQASAFLRHAKENYDDLYKFVEYQVAGLKLARAFLKIRETT